MARVNVNILGIRELKWTGMGEFNSDDLLLLLWAGIPYKKWSSLRNQQESLKCSTWMQSQKGQNYLSSFPRLPGATTGDRTHDKVMWKRTVKQGFRTQWAP